MYVLVFEFLFNRGLARFLCSNMLFYPTYPTHNIYNIFLVGVLGQNGIKIIILDCSKDFHGGDSCSWNKAFHFCLCSQVVLNERVIVLKF